MEIRKLDSAVSKLLSFDTILVEGKRDAESIRLLGFRGNIVEIAGKAPALWVGDVSGHSVAVLSDLDRNGLRLARTAEGILSPMGYAVDTRIREALAVLLGLKFFEELYSLYKRAKEVC